MDFALLGPLVVRRDQAAIPVPTGKQRVLLAALLLAADRVMTIDDLIDTMWDGRPPGSARITLQGHVKRLRRTLGDHTGSPIVTRPAGYTITTAGHELDVDRFNVLLADGQQHARRDRWQSLADTMRVALGLWRGQPLLDVPSQALTHTMLPRLTEMRLRALGWRIEADMRLDRHEQLIGELIELTDEFPLRERFHNQLMTALYRSGRQAEALAAYHHLRRLLADELGVDPDPQSQRLYHQILAADPALLAPLPPAESIAFREPIPRPVLVRPAQLPADLGDFVGRGSQVGHLAGVLTDRSEDASRALPVVAVTGVGGIGKTTLAVHVAHHVTGTFPDGQLYADLRGAGAQPRQAGDVLARFLRDLGVPDAAVPVDEEERVVRYRSLLADRRMLVLLDDVRDAAQLRPLIPGAACCAVLVTSRNRLSGLDGATVVALDGLDTADAGELFAGIVGTDRTVAEPAATARVVRACGGFPLAIRIAADRLATRPGWSVRTLADRLADERTRLRELHVADLAVRVTFQTSYHALPAATDQDGIDPARAFRLLALVPDPGIGLAAAAVLFDTSASQAEHALETLVDTHLLTAPEPGRYRFHDLLRVYAAERADAEEPTHVRTDSVHRLLTWYLASAAAADQVLMPASRPFTGDEHVPDRRFADYRQALRWLDIEHETLLAATRQATAIGRTPPCPGIRGTPAGVSGLAVPLGRSRHGGAHRRCQRQGVWRPVRRGSCALRPVQGIHPPQRVAVGPGRVARGIGHLPGTGGSARRTRGSGWPRAFLFLVGPVRPGRRVAGERAGQRPGCRRPTVRGARTGEPGLRVQRTRTARAGAGLLCASDDGHVRSGQSILPLSGRTPPRPGLRRPGQARRGQRAVGSSARSE